MDDVRPGRVLVIGLDGATWTLLRPWADAGLLPNVARLMHEGTYGVLNSVLPALSPSAWASFMTGTNPGQHGIYDFWKREPDSYHLRLVRADWIDRPSLWRLLSESGRRVGVVNVPMTYPPEEVEGFLVSGLGTPDFRPFAHPVSLFEGLRQRGYRVNKQRIYRPGQESAFLAEVQAMTDLQAGTALELMASQAWDLFMFVFRDTDEMAHFFWRFFDETHPAYDAGAAQQWGDALLEYYGLVDEWVGRMVAQAGPEATVFLISDHGAGPLYKDVFLNVWLERAGFLSRRLPARSRRWMRRLGFTREAVSRWLRRGGLGRWETWLKDRLGEKISLFPRSGRVDLQDAVDWSRTKAYSFGYHGQVFLNVRGREPQGIVEPGAQYEQVRDELIEALLAWRDPQDGQPVVTKLVRREEIYHGPRLEEAPDLVLVMRNFAYITRQGYEFGYGGGAVFSPPTTHESGSHRLEGVVVASGPGVRNLGEIEAVSIMDLAPTILYLLGERIPRWMDGRLLREWIAPDRLVGAPPRWSDVPYKGRQRDTSWTDEDEQEVVARLRGLGYLG